MRREFYAIAGLDDDGGAWASADPSSVPVVPAPRADRGPLAGWPLPAKLAANAWLPTGQYKLQSGDTLSGLARTYLGDYARWREIWSIQSNAFKTLPRRVDEAKRKGQTPVDVIFAGEVLDMPAEAIEEARRQGLLVRHDSPSQSIATGPKPLPSPARVMLSIAAFTLVGVGLSENWWGKFVR